MRPVVQLWSRVCLALVNRSSCPRSRSVSAPSSVTYTSPCWYGLIVPGSTFRYGSHFWRVTRRPRFSSRQPIDAAATPLPREETTPPVTKIYFGPIRSVPFAKKHVWNWVNSSKKMLAYNAFYGLCFFLLTQTLPGAEHGALGGLHGREAGESDGRIHIVVDGLHSPTDEI